MVPRILSDQAQEPEIRQESFAEAHRYMEVPSAFVADTVLDVRERPAGLQLCERPLAKPFRKDYDAINDPTQWRSQFDVSHWAVFAAYRGSRRSAVPSPPSTLPVSTCWKAAAIWPFYGICESCRTPVVAEVGALLFDAVEVWGALHRCRELKIETQNTNVAACRFYASRGCTLQQANRGVYPELPLEIQLIWTKTIDSPLRGFP